MNKKEDTYSIRNAYSDKQLNYKHTQKKWVAGMYLRLSSEDRNKVSRSDNSESIENQESICRRWLEQHPEVVLYDIYIDDGYTGLDYNRVDYQRLKNDIDNGPVNMILCKSLVRFGREQIETLILFKREFVYRDIRFVGVVDNIDYIGSDPMADDGINIPMRCLMNDYSSRRTSLDVRSVIKEKQKDGEFIGAFASYGYVKDPEDKNHLLVDPYAAEIVKRIYSLFLLGNNIKFIANQLNLDGVLCPTLYKQEVQKLTFRCNNKLDSTTYWCYHTIKNILRNPLYTGCVVQHKKEKIAYNIKKFKVIPRSEWTIVPNKHEAIISQEDFDRVQQLIQTRTRQVNAKNLSPYAGVIVCGDCGRAMTKQQFEGVRGYRYRCGTYAKIGKDFCTQHAIYTVDLDKLLLREINKIVKQISDDDMAYAAKQLQKHTAKSVSTETIEQLQLRRVELDKEKREMLIFLSKHVLSDEDFMLYNEEYEKKARELEQQILIAKKNESDQKNSAEQYAEYVQHFLKYREATQVDREMVVNLVEKITVFEDRVLIKFLFKNPYFTNSYPNSRETH